MMSSASTKNVVTKGMMSVNQGQCIATAKISAAVEMKNNSQYNPFDLCFTSINRIFAKIGENSFRTILCTKPFSVSLMGLL